MDSEKIEKYRTALLHCALAAKLLGTHDLPKLLSDINRAETLGPMVDPTLYREQHLAMAQDKALLEAALKSFGRS